MDGTTTALSRHLVPAALVAVSMVVHFARAELPDYPMTKQEMKVAAGYYTESGKYLGGVPKLDSEIEFYECLSFISASHDTTASSSAVGSTDSDNAAVCLEWTANESSEDETETGMCQCQYYVEERYCESWTCSQVETDNYDSDCSGSRRLDDGNGCYIEVEAEHTICQCDVEDDESIEFCPEWSCEETDNDGTIEEEHYTCVRASASGLYCEAWTGEIESSEEVEVSSCECSDNWNGDGMCSYWTCKERGMDKCGSCNLTVAIAAFGLIGIIGVVSGAWALVVAKTMRESFFIVLIFGLVWPCAWSSGVVIWGGQDGAMIVGIMWLTPFVLAVLARCVFSYGGTPGPREMSVPCKPPSQ